MAAETVCQSGEASSTSGVASRPRAVSGRVKRSGRQRREVRHTPHPGDECSHQHRETTPQPDEMPDTEQGERQEEVVAREQVVDAHPNSELPAGARIAFPDRKDETQRIAEVGRDPRQPHLLHAGFAHQTDMALR